MTLKARFGLLGGGAATVLLVLATAANADICIIPPSGDLPPQCQYASPQQVHMIIDGLPAGSTIMLDATHREFSGVTVTNPGGTLGGEAEQFTSQVFLQLTGTGDLAGWQRTVFIPNVQVETHVGPHDLSGPVESFDTLMWSMQGQITNPGSGDPDFDLLRITAGNGYSLPSPGHTTLTQLPGGNWNVDSFFDITYRIDFVGRFGGPLSGMSGSTTGTIRMQAGERVPEPATMLLSGLALVGGLGIVRKQRS